MSGILALLNQVGYGYTLYCMIGYLLSILDECSTAFYWLHLLHTTHKPVLLALGALASIISACDTSSVVQIPYQTWWNDYIPRCIFTFLVNISECLVAIMTCSICHIFFLANVVPIIHWWVSLVMDECSVHCINKSESSLWPRVLRR